MVGVESSSITPRQALPINVLTYAKVKQPSLLDNFMPDISASSGGSSPEDAIVIADEDYSHIKNELQKAFDRPS